MHDLLEDTDYDPSNLPKNFKKALKLLTKPDEVNYNDYCEKIHYLNFKRYGLCAWFVKLADMKDHLSQVDTLTPRLKEKYLSGLRYLLWRIASLKIGLNSLLRLLLYVRWLFLWCYLSAFQWINQTVEKHITMEFVRRTAPTGITLDVIIIIQCQNIIFVTINILLSW